MNTPPDRSSWDWIFFGVVSQIFLTLCCIVALNGAPGGSSFNLGPLNLVSGRFIILYIFSWASFMLLFLAYPQGRHHKRNMGIILLLSFISHLLWMAFPASDDVNRYLWEGHLLLKGISPYHHPPGDPFLAGLAKGFIHFPGINHPEISAAYPPLLLFVFSLLGIISMDPLVIKIAMAGLDLLAVFLLIRCLEDRNMDIRWSMLYAINPLVLLSFAGEGHGDVLQTVFLLGALCLFHRKRHALMFIFLGLAVQSKLVALLVFPFFITRENRWFSPLFPTMVILPVIPFSTEGWPDIFRGLLTFGSDFAFNGPVQSLLEALGSDRDLSRLMCALMFGCLYLFSVFIFRSGGPKNPEKSPIQGSLAVLGGLILFSPTVHPWYICWVLPLAVLPLKRSWLVLSLSLCFYYVAPGMEHPGGSRGLPGWAVLAQWLPFALIFCIESAYALIRSPHKIRTAPVQSVSVVVPAINEEKTIANCIKHIAADPSVIEVIVVDGGSTDKTRDAARQAGATVVSHPNPPERGGGRGGQIKRGIKETRGDVVAVVHADTRLARHAFNDLLLFLNQNPRVFGGALGTVFDRPSLRMKIIECLNTLRSTFFSISFGDQIQFFRRQPVVETNCFPDLPLMEDVEFSLQLLRLGQTAYLFGYSQVSSRRWQEKGLGNAVTVLRCFFAYLAKRVWKKPDTLSMYRRYYGK